MNNILGYSASDNLYEQCPPKMSDGRTYSNSRQPIELDLILQGPKNNWDYRHYLINNANSIMSLNKKYSLNSNTNAIPCNIEIGNYAFNSPYTENTQLMPNNLKVTYLTKCDLDSRLYAPQYPLQLTQDNILTYPRSN